MILFLSGIISYIVLTAISIRILWNFRAASPIFWYPISLTLMSIGIFLQIDLQLSSDRLHAILNFLATFFFIAAATLYALTFKLELKLKRFLSKPLLKDSNQTKLIVYLIFAISLFFTLLYYSRVGGNMIIMAITSGIADDYSTIRLSMYAGDTYTGAGYFNQFKNFLLPLTSMIIAFYLWGSHRRISYLVIPFLLIVYILAVAGAGQRTYLVFSFVAIVFGLSLLNLGHRQLVNFKIIFASILLFLVFSTMTAFYKGTEGNIIDSMSLSIERIFYSQQWAGLEAFRYIYDRPIVWFEEWSESLLGILPNNRGSTLANEIHDFMFDSFRGTAPPTLVGSAYYNGGITLVIVTFLLLGLLYAYIYDLFLRGKRTPARCFGYGSLFFYLTTFFVGTPKYIFDNGIIAFIFFLILIKIRIKKNLRAVET